MWARSGRHAAAGGVIAVSLLMSSLAAASESAASAAATPAPPRFRLASTLTETAPQATGRYTMRARFAPTERAGELREADHFALIGRFAKASVGCGGGGLVFKDGFEAP